MKTRGLCFFAIVVITSIACSSRNSQRNESCQSTADCAGDLVCIGGRCGPVNLGIQPATNQCVAVQCVTADDCCANPPCMNVNCTMDKCVQSTMCTTDAQCFGAARHCNNGTCVECLMSTDCGFKQTCTPMTTCATSCTADNECPIFYACQSMSCTKVGCASDRECILYKDSEFAFCDATKTCSVKCDNDAQCGMLELCVNHGCVAAGCTTDEECKAILGTLPPGEHAVCRKPM
jgi:hypothetical protein